MSWCLFTMGVAKCDVIAMLRGLMQYRAASERLVRQRSFGRALHEYSTKWYRTAYWLISGEVPR